MGKDRFLTDAFGSIYTSNMASDFPPDPTMIFSRVKRLTASRSCRHASMKATRGCLNDTVSAVIPKNSNLSYSIRN